MGARRNFSRGGQSLFPSPPTLGSGGLLRGKNCLSCTLCPQVYFDTFWSRESITSYRRFNASGDIFWPLLWYRYSIVFPLPRISTPQSLFSAVYTLPSHYSTPNMHSPSVYSTRKMHSPCDINTPLQ